MPEKSLTFAIVDDKRSEIERMSAHILQLPNVKVVSKVRNARELQQKLAELPKLPDFILIDIKIGADFKEGYRIAANLKQKYPLIHLILVSEYSDTAFLKEVIARGTAKGFIKKSNFAFGLRKAIDLILDEKEYWEEVPKESYINNIPQMLRKSERMLKEEKHWHLPPEERAKIKITAIKTTITEVKAYLPQCQIQSTFELSVQKWIIFKKLALGCGSKEIAAILHTSTDSINTQKSAIRDQLEISGQTDVWFLIKALELGVVEARTFLEQQTGITIID